LADAGVVLVDGLVEHPLTLSAADLVSSPATELDNTTLTGHGSESAHYKGVALWWLVEHAGFVVEPGAKRAICGIICLSPAVTVIKSSFPWVKSTRISRQSPPSWPMTETANRLAPMVCA